MWAALAALLGQEPQTGGAQVPAWTVAVGAVVGAVAVFLVRVVPVFSRVANERATRASRLANDETNRGLKADAQQAQLRLQANEQVFAQYQLLIKQQSDRLDDVADKVEQLTRENAACEERCRHLESRITELEHRQNGGAA